MKMRRPLLFFCLFALILLSVSSVFVIVVDFEQSQTGTVIQPRILGQQSNQPQEFDQYYLYDQAGKVSTNSAGGNARITFCKIMVNEAGDILSQELPPGTTFKINIYRDPSPKYPELPNDPGLVWKTLTFTPPYNLNRDLLYADGINDAHCAPTDSIEFDAESFDIAYDLESINSNQTWVQPQYNDQFTHNIVSLTDFFNYSNELYDGVVGNENSRNKNSDGHVVLDPNSNRIVAILNRTLFVAPTAEPTAPVTITPAITTPTASLVTPLPTATPKISTSPAPSRVQTKEVLLIDTAQTKLSSDCSSQGIVISDINIKTSQAIATFAYRLRDVENWHDVALGDNNYSQQVTVHTGKIPQDLYQIQLRAISVSGQTTEANLGNYALECSGRIVILGNYYQNGFNHAFLDRHGNVLYNPALKLQLYAEVLTPVAQLYLRLAKSESALWTDPAEILPMNYDFNAKLWTIELTPELLSGPLTYSGLSVDTDKTEQVFIKPIEPIINLETEPSPETGYSYEIYSKEATTWHKLDYKSELNDHTDNAFQLFNLYPGQYYFKVDYPNSRAYYSEEFELTVPAVVQVQTTSEPKYKALAGVDHLLRNLDIEIVSKYEEPTAVAAINVSMENDFELYYDLIKDTELENEDKLIFIYWNRWNPYFDEQNDNYLDLDQLLAQFTDSEQRLVLLTDSNNFEELRRTVLVRQVPANVILVDNDYFLNHELRYQPELVIYDPADKQIERLRGNDNLSELRTRLNALNYFSDDTK